ncbi:helix-hairpin-helix domain-containing protein [Campylobacter concisus]|uniref:Late competence protein ComEA, DNA receptor n=1 Tax=Campylobacter concisus TaxID=199 RepID=A0A2R4P0S1_9BACT|nr:helix-hairpin-helix domain-containing protein [Campylobacter concisus]AVX44287.1 Late competence protein ComEA, DNA receptor [Campylobacter concisus]
MKRLKILLCLALASFAYGADLNTASKSELMSLGLNKSQALNVIKYRKAHKFTSVEELEKVQGIGFNDMQKVKEKLSVKDGQKAKKAEPEKKSKNKKLKSKKKKK